MSTNINTTIYAKKKGHPFLKFLLVLFIIIAILIGVPIALLYIFIYDSGTKEVWHNNEITLNDYMDSYSKNLLAKSFNDTKSTGKVEFTLQEGDVNTILSYTMGELPSQVKQYVTGAYLDVTTDTYNFYVNASTPFFPYFKTRVCLVAELKDLEGEDKGFELRFKDAKIGKASGLFWIADKFVTQSMIEDIFKGSKMNFEVDWPNHSVKYKLENMLADFGLAGSSSEDNVFFDMIKDIFQNNQNVISTDYYSKKGINVAVDLSSAHGEFTPITDFKDTIAQIRNEYKSAQSTDGINERFIEVAKELGEKPAEGKDIQDCLAEHADAITKETYISEEELNAYLRGSDLIGKLYTFVGDDIKTNERTINFIVFNDFYCDIKQENKVQFTINLSINGYDTQMTVDASVNDAIKLNEQGKLTLDFAMSDIKYGNLISLWDEEKDQPKNIITDLIKSGFSADSSSDIKVSGKNISVVIDNPIYAVGNKITTDDNKLNVQVFMPKFYSGNTTPDLYFSTLEGLIVGDKYFDLSTSNLYNFNGTSWGTGINVLDPLFLADPANTEIINYLVEQGFISLP